MTKIWRSGAALLLSAALMLPLAACNGAGSPDSSQPADSQSGNGSALSSAAAAGGTQTSGVTGSPTSAGTSPGAAPSSSATGRRTVTAAATTATKVQGNTNAADPSGYVIVRGARATRVEQQAAKELQSYLKQITGTEIPIVTDSTAETPHEFIIGSTARSLKVDKSRLEYDGFAVVKQGNRIAVEGVDDRSTLYGVYHLLEAYFGCRFYAEDFEVIPASSSINLPAAINDVQNPALEFRDVNWHSTVDTVFAAKMRINSDHNRRTSNSYGQGIRYAGGLFVHTFSYLLSASEYFSSHPEYFGLNANGERDRSTLCLSNPEVVGILAQNTLELLDKDPDAQIVSVSQNDVNRYCQCSDCRAIIQEEGSPAGPVIRAVNQVAAAVAEKYPDVMVDTLAYMYSQTPCKTKPADNVIVRLCSFYCAFDTPLNDDERSVNRTFANDLEGWGRLTDNIYVWDYTTDFDFYLYTFPNFSVLQENVRFLLNNHVTGIFEQGNVNEGGEFGELRAYLLSKLLWNPDVDVQALMDEFLAAYYGSGWKNIKTYITEFENLVDRLGTSATIYVNPNALTPFANANTQSFVRQAGAWWDAAEEAASGQQLEHVRRSRLQYTYLAQSVNYSSQRNTAAWKETNRQLLDAIKEYGIMLREVPEGSIDDVDVNASPLTWQDT